MATVLSMVVVIFTGGLEVDFFRKVFLAIGLLHSTPYKGAWSLEYSSDLLLGVLLE